MNKSKILGFAAGPLTKALLSLLIVPLITWIFNVEDVGRLAFYYIAISFSFLFFSFGLEQAFIRYFYDCEDKGQLLRSTFFPGFLCLSFAVLSLVLLKVDLSLWIFDYSSLFISNLIYCSLLSNFILVFASSILRMEERSLLYSVIQVLPRVFFVLLLLSSLIWKELLNFEVLILFHCIASVLSLVIAIWLTLDIWRLALTKSRSCAKSRRELYLFALPLVGNGVAIWGLNAVDRFSLKCWGSLEEVAILAVAMNFAAVGAIIRGIFSTIWAPYIFKKNVEGLVAKDVQVVLDKTVVLVSLVFSLGASLSWGVVYLVPDAYTSIQFFIPACFLFSILNLFSDITMTGLNIEKKTTWIMFSAIFVFVLNFSLNYLFVPIWGVRGAVISTSLSMYIFLILKTELSNYQWEKLNRKNLYITATLFLGISISETFLVSSINWLFHLVWLFIFSCLFIKHRILLKEVLSRFKLKKYFS